tara:strand:- start:86 stop:529 length:444 start_codon:yes stop_codon:yes gene_type:complete
LSAIQNLDYPVQAVQLIDIFHYCNDGINRTTYDFYKWCHKDTLDWKECLRQGNSTEYPLIDLKILEESIKLEGGMQFPIILRKNNHDMLIFFSGGRRITHALLHDYTSIDAIVLKNETSVQQRLSNLQLKQFQMGQEYFSKVSEMVI